MTARQILICALAVLAGAAGLSTSYGQRESAIPSVQAGGRESARLDPKQEQSGEQRITDQAYRPRAARRLVQMQRIEEDKVEDGGAGEADGVDATDEKTFEPSRRDGDKERILLFGF